MVSQHNRRRHARIRVDLPAEWRLGQERHATKGVQFSDGGCFLTTDAWPARGDDLWITIHLSPVTALTVRAEVRHRTPVGFGARFLDQTDEQRALLTQAVAELEASGVQ